MGGMNLPTAFKVKWNAPFAVAVVCLCWLSIVWQQNLEVIGGDSYDVSSSSHLEDEVGALRLPIKMMEKPKSHGRTSASNENTGSGGSFNTLPVRLRSDAFRSFVHCTHQSSGATDVDDSWKLRSCRFTNLCFDVELNRYVVFYDKSRKGNKHPTHLAVVPGSNETQAVAMGGINPRWDSKRGFDKGSWKVKWFPDVRPTTEIPPTYLQLDDSTLLIPFHSFAGHNVGHMLWDDFYPIWRLVHLFRLVDESGNPLRWLLIRHVLELTLYASCDIRRNKRMQCTSNFQKFLPLLGVQPETFSSSKRVELSLKNGGILKDNVTLVCARHGIAGLGMLTDHGRHDHGWEPKTTWIPHNLGRGRQFYDFSSFVNSNVEQAFGTASSQSTRRSMTDKPQISFSLLSSQDRDRRLDFALQIRALRKSLTSDAATVQSYTLWNMTLQEQLNAVSSSSIFITACGGGSMTATFLPRGATLIVYYNPTGGLDFETMQPNGAPARLDWDLLNNAAHLRVHWLPTDSMNDDRGLQLFVSLVKHEVRARPGP